MALRDYISRILTLRRIVKAIDELVRLQTRQTVALERLADRFAPPPPVVDEKDLKRADASFVDYALQGRIQDYVEQVQRDTGREPTEEEIVAYLEGEDRRL